jgi:hypothetical protein
VVDVRPRQAGVAECGEELALEPRADRRRGGGREDPGGLELLVCHQLQHEGLGAEALEFVVRLCRGRVDQRSQR